MNDDRLKSYSIYGYKKTSMNMKDLLSNWIFLILEYEYTCWLMKIRFIFEINSILWLNTFLCIHLYKLKTTTAANQPRKRKQPLAWFCYSKEVVLYPKQWRVVNHGGIIYGPWVIKFNFRRAKACTNVSIQYFAAKRE